MPAGGNADVVGLWGPSWVTVCKVLGECLATCSAYYLLGMTCRATRWVMWPQLTTWPDRLSLFLSFCLLTSEVPLGGSTKEQVAPKGGWVCFWGNIYKHNMPPTSRPTGSNGKQITLRSNCGIQVLSWHTR